MGKEIQTFHQKALRTKIFEERGNVMNIIHIKIVNVNIKYNNNN